MRSMLVAFCTLAVTLQSALAADTKPAAGTTEQTFQHGGLDRTYRIHVPTSYDSKKPVPLVFAFHGGGGSSLIAEKGLGLNPLSDKQGFIVVYPQGVDNHWNDGRVSPRFANATKIDDVSFIRALIDRLEKTYNIDPLRIYSTGNSNGGFFSQRLGWELSDQLAAIAPSAGTLGENVVKQFAPKHPIHVLEIHGTADPAVPYNGGEVIAKGGMAISVPDMVRLWVKTNGCKEPAKVEYLPKKDPNDPTQVRRETYAPGEKGAEVVLYAIEGHGHTWAGRGITSELSGPATKQLDAAEVVWDFFQKHPKVSEHKP